MIECVKICEQGFSHKVKNKLCQDSAVTGTDKSKNYSILAIADGHGGERYFRSEIGSKIAVEVAKEETEKLVITMKSNKSHSKKIDLEKTTMILEQNIINSWQNRVEEYNNYNEWTSEELELIERLKINFEMQNEDTEIERSCDVKLHNSEVLKCYGTTLLTALYISESNPTFSLFQPIKPLWIVLQIGDGLTFALDENNEDFLPIPEDERLGFGITTSLCSSKAAQEFRHNFGRTKLNALVLCSDGVADSFMRDKFGNFVRKIQRNIKEHGRETVQKELQEFFPKLSEQGSGDDVSLAGVFEMGEEGGKK